MTGAQSPRKYRRSAMTALMAFAMPSSPLGVVCSAHENPGAALLQQIRYATAWFDWEMTKLEGAQC